MLLPSFPGLRHHLRSVTQRQTCGHCQLAEFGIGPLLPRQQLEQLNTIPPVGVLACPAVRQPFALAAAILVAQPYTSQAIALDLNDSDHLPFVEIAELAR